MVSNEKTTEDEGECYGFNLIYSGNHYEAIEVNGHGKTRLVSGINPQSFCYLIAPSESFETEPTIIPIDIPIHEPKNKIPSICGYLFPKSIPIIVK